MMTMSIGCAACARPSPKPPAPAAQAPLIASLRQAGIALRPVGRALPARAPSAPAARPQGHAALPAALPAALRAASERCPEIAVLAARLQGPTGAGAGRAPGPVNVRGCAQVEGESEALTVCLGAPLPPPLHRAVVTEIAAGARRRAVSAEEVHGDEAAGARRRAALHAALMRAFGPPKEDGPSRHVFHLAGYEIILSAQGASVDLALRQVP